VEWKNAMKIFFVKWWFVFMHNLITKKYDDIFNNIFTIFWRNILKWWLIFQEKNLLHQELPGFVFDWNWQKENLKNVWFFSLTVLPWLTLFRTLWFSIYARWQICL
jgi:hypothetical protein